MLERGKISSLAAVILLVDLVGATALMFLPAVSASYAHQDAWMVPILATVPGMYVILLVAGLARRFPGLTFIQYMEAILGRWPGKVLALFYLFFFIHSNSVIVRELTHLLSLMIYNATPQPVFDVVIIILSAYAVYMGLEVIARVGLLTFPILLFAFLFIIIVAVTSAGDLNNLRPVLANGIKPVIAASLTPTAWRGEVLLLAMFAPFLANPRQTARVGIWGVAIIGFFLLFNAMANLAVFGPETERLSFPTFTLLLVSPLPGLEPFFIAIFITGMIIKISIFYYVAVLGTAQLFELKSYRPLVIPVGVLLAALASFWPSHVEMVSYTIKGFTPFAFLMEHLIPTLLFAGAWLKKQVQNQDSRGGNE